MKIRTVSAPNIALIKYWGNRNEELRLPAADSLSMTLDSPTVEVSIEAADAFSVRSFETNGEKKELSEKETGRLQKHFELCKMYADERGSPLPSQTSVEIRSYVPKSVGLASSAAVFSALAEGYAGFAPELSRKDVSVFARLGSGSASRSVFGGFVAMLAGEGGGLGDSYAEQIEPENHWELWDIVIAPSIDEKKTGSTEGHALAPTSPLFEKRLRELPDRQKMCIEAIKEKNFLKLRIAAEVDCLDMHAVMESSNPPLRYLSAETHRIVKEVETFRAEKSLNILYTMDAGPTVHLLCDVSAVPAVREYAQKQKNCTIFEAKVSKGSRLL